MNITQKKKKKKYEFKKKLKKDIEEKQQLYKNSKDFIKYNKLIKYNGKYPFNLYMGNCYLIKNNSIILIESYMGYDIDIIRYKSTIYILNIELNDINMLEEPNSILELDSITTNDTEETKELINILLQLGFNFWIKNK